MLRATGIGYLDAPVTSDGAPDPERWSRILATQPHNFAGARTSSYHAVICEWYINEVLRRKFNTTVHNVA